MTSVVPKDWEKKHSSFNLLFAMPDNINQSKKMIVGFGIGAKIGLAGSCANILLTPYTTFEQILYTRKMWALLTTSKGFMVGAFSGCMYVATAQQVCRLRGNKDDWINHFAAAYAGVLPYSVLFKQTWKFFLMGGTVFGIGAAIAKLSGQSDLIKNTYTADRCKETPTKYPEIYLHYHVLKEQREEKQRQKNLLD
ncbi:uncharacterized protein LOC123524683 [Mercenaria mercenaria]|uniref:uncharacterized protein LOC123524683 n=1 Tax=Mercenaria mercenaria TaxID=6596 RepID=UPI00234E988A|nr:uncharacterized protein LOC123524683 [Mercenaria mercenaria]